MPTTELEIQFKTHFSLSTQPRRAQPGLEMLVPKPFPLASENLLLSHPIPTSSQPKDPDFTSLSVTNERKSIQDLMQSSPDFTLEIRNACDKLHVKTLQQNTLTTPVSPKEHPEQNHMDILQEIVHFK